MLISVWEEMRRRLLKIFMSGRKVIYKLYGKKTLFFALLFHLDNVLWMHPTQKVYVLSAVTSRVLVLQLPFCSNSPTQLVREALKQTFYMLGHGILIVFMVKREFF